MAAPAPPSTRRVDEVPAFESGAASFTCASASAEKVSGVAAWRLYGCAAAADEGGAAVWRARSPSSMAVATRTARTGRISNSPCMRHPSAERGPQEYHRTRRLGTCCGAGGSWLSILDWGAAEGRRHSEVGLQ